ncbi:hypothetical protein SAMN05421505_120132 [Sinosporangium album]|uniref:Uncharacterized protein n=1 Tax=Sinosporangium album TaxID=504805 RepID=A0A1G8EK14_9ACTN|nr:hypothetical protein [Sinosporangium album]SDH70166.1 hypothetical protein SAMN05421505_120132 [Sinosporangium album]
MDLTNTCRAERAETALTAYTETAYLNPADRDLTDPETRKEAATDLIGDLLHLLDRATPDSVAAFEHAFSVYREELADDDPGDQLPLSDTNH